jgi:hypothetical protein
VKLRFVRGAGRASQEEGGSECKGKHDNETRQKPRAPPCRGCLDVSGYLADSGQRLEIKGEIVCRLKAFGWILLQTVPHDAI